MTTDILESSAYLALGSRLKRLAERLQADAARAHAELGFAMKPSQFPLLAALDASGPMTFGEAVDALGVSQPAVTRTLGTLMAQGWVATRTDPANHRSKIVELTPSGRTHVARMKRVLWPHIRAAAVELAEPGFLEQLSSIEAAVAEMSLGARIRRQREDHLPIGLVLREFDDGLVEAFSSITREWVEEMFTLEDEDRHIIDHPRASIIDKGGVILFVEAEDLGVVGTCALMPVEGKTFELTKMGVLASARGRRAGDFLLDKTLERAMAMHSRGELDELFLLTNRACEAAIHLYEMHGFLHDQGVMDRFGHRYARCDVAMSYGF